MLTDPIVKIGCCWCTLCLNGIECLASTSSARVGISLVSFCLRFVLVLSTSDGSPTSRFGVRALLTED